MAYAGGLNSPSGRDSAPGSRFFFFAVLSIVLMYFDQRDGWSERIRYVLQAAAYPIQVAVGSPRQLWVATRELFESRGSLREENAGLQQQVREMSVKGRNLSEGVPRSFTLNSNEILEAMQEPLQGIVQAVKKALEQTPPELGSDVAERGIVLTGGGALLKDIDKLLMEETGLPVVIAEDPLTCVARGGGRILELNEEHPGLFGLR